MTNFGEIYLCEISGKGAGVLDTGNGVLNCCGQEMLLYFEN